MPKKPEKQRADALLVARGFADSRARAQALIMAGLVFSGQQCIAKPGQTLATDAAIELRGRDHPWVSRGGLKLVAALDQFAISVQGRTALDIGASTGGFTHVLLSRDARRVFAVDVGHGQFAWSLRNDPRIVLLERTNARYLTAEQITAPVDLIVCDASFIGLETLLPAALALAAPGADLVALIKPQFEVTKGQVGKQGVVRDPDLHRAVCTRIENWLAARPGWSVRGIVESPITGPKGNKEFLIAFEAA